MKTNLGGGSNVGGRVGVDGSRISNTTSSAKAAEEAMVNDRILSGIWLRLSSCSCG